MSDLRKRFGRLVAAHRRRVGMTQQELAEATEVSVFTISKIETGTAGARFPLIERLANALGVDPAELFTSEIPSGAVRRQAYAAITGRLIGLSDGDLEWVGKILSAALESRNQPAKPPAPGSPSR